ncbi:cupredoxin domain-containing protein [Methanobacterium sp.]|uniref:cupredoxin domain-containing protein n=1 Tax=Methanobacterium sp. TaxID=2164 RepID=UPI003C768285
MANKKYVGIAVIVLFFVMCTISASFVMSASKTHVTKKDNINSADAGDDGIDTNMGSEITVLIQNSTFIPSNLTVKAGTTVLWINNDSDVKYMVTGSGFMSPHLTEGQNFSYTFNKTGTYAYYDMDHMDNKKLTGTIMVH